MVGSPVDSQISPRDSCAPSPEDAKREMMLSLSGRITAALVILGGAVGIGGAGLLLGTMGGLGSGRGLCLATVTAIGGAGATGAFAAAGAFLLATRLAGLLNVSASSAE